MEGMCPYCEEYDELTEYDGAYVCTLCEEEFKNKDTMRELENQDSLNFE